MGDVRVALVCTGWRSGVSVWVLMLCLLADDMCVCLFVFVFVL
jgi:hypothetical protein